MPVIPTLALVATVALAAAATPRPADGPAARFTITARGVDGDVVVEGDRCATTFVVRSKAGIGRAAIGRRGADWPKAVAFRLHLKGLEAFRASAGTIKLGAAVSSADRPPAARVWANDKEDTPLAADSPLRLGVRAVAANGKPAAGVPLDGGWFEVDLPPGLFDGNPDEFVIEWVDFHRG